MKEEEPSIVLTTCEGHSMDPNDTDAQVKKDPTDKEAAEYAEVDQNEMSGDSSKALDDE